MALGIGRAAGIVAGICALVAFVWLPPEPASRDRAARPGQGRDVLQQVRREVGHTRRELSLAAEGLQFLQRRDSLATTLASARGALVTVAAPDVSRDWRNWLAEGAAQLRERRDVAVAEGKVLSALFVDTISEIRRSPEQLRWQRWRNSTVTAFGTASAPFTCITIHDLRRTIRSEGQRRLLGPGRFPSRSALGICRFFATYGRPGPAVQRWLQDGGWRFGATEAVAYRGVFQQPYFVRATIFSYFMTEGQLALGSCLGGSTDGCRGWVLTPDRQGFWVTQLDSSSTYAAGWRDWYGDGLLDGLEQEMGPERLRAFWTSSLPLDSAFASAFGVDIGTWTYGWLDRQFGPLPRKGPGPRDYAVTVLMAGLLIAFGAAKAHARNVK